MNAKEKLKDKIVSDLNNWMEAHADQFADEYIDDVVVENGFGYLRPQKESGEKPDDRIYHTDGNDITLCRNKVQTIAKYLKTHKIDKNVIETIKAGKIH